MDILLVRHSVAEPGGGRADHERTLTAEGLARADRLARTIGRMGLRPERVYHSPLVRAVQTAERLTAGAGGARETLELLAAPPSQGILYAMEGRCVALVGHQPWMSELVGWMVLGDRALGARFPFEPAQAAWLSGEPRPGGMFLRAFLSPEALIS